MATSIIKKDAHSDFTYVYGTTLDANSLFRNGYYRNTNTISNTPSENGHLIVTGHPDLNSKAQIYIDSDGYAGYIRGAWGAGSTSFTNSWRPIAASKWAYLGSLDSSSMTANTYASFTVSDLFKYSLIRFNISYYATGLPDYGGITVPYQELAAAKSEPIMVQAFNSSGRFSVKFVNNETLSAVCTAPAAHFYLVVHGVM